MRLYSAIRPRGIRGARSVVWSSSEARGSTRPPTVRLGSECSIRLRRIVVVQRRIPSLVDVARRRRARLSQNERSPVVENDSLESPWGQQHLGRDARRSVTGPRPRPTPVLMVMKDLIAWTGGLVPVVPQLTVHDQPVAAECRRASGRRRSRNNIR